jgi:hypothetical protein
MQLFDVLIENISLIVVNQMLFDVNNDEEVDVLNQEELYLTKMLKNLLHELMVKVRNFLKNY